MFYTVSFWSALLPLLGLTLGSSGEEKEKVIRALGESVIFQLKFSEPFTTVSWLRSEDVANVAFFKLENICETVEVLSDFEGRLNVSEDCKRLQVNNLNQEDSGTYKAQIRLRDKKDQLKFLFDLQLYKRLSEADLSIRCDKIGNETWRLNCSAGPWEDGVKFSMASDSQREISERSFDVQTDLKGNGPNVTCTVENPIGNTSRTESLKEICAELLATRPTTVPASQNEKGNGSATSSGPLVGGIIAVIVIVACCVIFLCWQKKKKASFKDHPSSSELDGGNTIYARVGDVEDSQPRGKPTKKTKTSQTIYTTVEHPYKPNPLQTDDEKMQKERLGATEQSEKTIYSEITKPEESEEQSIRTVYETVKNPRPPKEQKYTNII